MVRKSVCEKRERETAKSSSLNRFDVIQALPTASESPLDVFEADTPLLDTDERGVILNPLVPSGPFGCLTT